MGNGNRANDIRRGAAVLSLTPSRQRGQFDWARARRSTTFGSGDHPDPMSPPVRCQWQHGCVSKPARALGRRHLTAQLIATATILLSATSAGCASTHARSTLSASTLPRPFSSSTVTTTGVVRTTIVRTTVGHPAAVPSSRSRTSTSNGPFSAPEVVTVSDADNGRTVTLTRREVLKVVLNSTYWQITGSSDSAVLRPRGPAQVNPQPEGCVPGAGCGTVTQSFVAVSSGLAAVTATRSSCGEAEGCLPSAAEWKVTVRVQ